MSTSTIPQYPRMPRRPGDNRSDATRFFDDVRDLSRMASIALQMHEKLLVRPHSIEAINGTNIDKYTEKNLAEFQFALMDIDERAALLVMRCEQMEEMLKLEM